MRILLCKGQIYGPISGSDETLVTYASQLQRAGHDVSVLLMYLHAEEDQYYQRLLEAEVPVFWIASNLAHTSIGDRPQNSLQNIPCCSGPQALHSAKKFTGRHWARDSELPALPRVDVVTEARSRARPHP